MDNQDQITYIGKVDHRNKMTKFGIKPRDRTKHMYIIGKTGTGKSTFLENMIVQDIQNGHGVAFIDPHGGSADKLLDYIPEWRLNDVIYFNPSDMEFPVAFNPLEDPGPEKRHLVTDGLMSVFKKIWPEAFSGRMEYILNMTMMALMEYPDSTVLSINRMLTDKDFRKRVIASVTDSAVRNAWDELMKWDDKRWSEAIGALVNKVGQFSTNPVIRNIIGQPKSSFDLRKAMDERKIIIMNLSKGQIGEQNAPLLGAMLITKIYLAAMSRAELPGHVMEKMPPFYFYVDEFQNFANESFASILSEARKYKLCLTVANQFIAQMEETIRDAVFGNMGSIVAFRVGPLDAEFMEKVFAPVFTQEDLQNIAMFQMYLTLQIDNLGSKPFSARALEPIPPLRTSMRDQVVDASRKNFAQARAAVEEHVKEFFGYSKASAKVISSDTVESTRPPEQVRTYMAPDKPVVPRPPVVQHVVTLPTVPMPPRQPVTNNVKPKVATPVAPIVGFKKPTLIAKAPVAPVAPASMPTPAPKTSSSLASLLDQMDDMAIVEEKPTSPVLPAAIHPLLKEERGSASIPARPLVAQKPVTAERTPFVDPKMNRAASPEKKSALAEALAKAVAQNKPVVSPPQSPVVQKPEGVAQIPVQDTPQPPTPASLGPISPSEGNRLREGESNIPPVVEIPQPIAMPTPPVMKTSNTPREVPEDILRKVLE